MSKLSGIDFYNNKLDNIFAGEKEVSCLDSKIQILRADLDASSRDANFYLKKRMVAVASTVAALSLLALTSSMSGLAMYFVCSYVPFNIPLAVIHTFTILAIGTALYANVLLVKNSIKGIFRNKQNDEMEIKQFEKEKCHLQAKLNVCKNKTRTQFQGSIEYLEGHIQALNEATSAHYSESALDRLRDLYYKITDFKNLIDFRRFKMFPKEYFDLVKDKCLDHKLQKEVELQFLRTAINLIQI